MIIFLDSNVLFREYGQLTFNFSALVRYVSAHGHQLIIPEIVYRETERLYHERIDGYNQDINLLFDQQRPTVLTATHLDSVLLDTSGMMTRFWEGLFARSVSAPASIRMDAYKPAHRVLAIERVLANRMPMKVPDRNGKLSGSVNARDALIWLSILDVVRDTVDTDQRYVLVTGDSDFRGKKDKGAVSAHLHQHLIEDLRQLNVREEQFHLFMDLNRFLASVGKDLDILEAEIVDLEIKRQDMHSYMAERSRIEDKKIQLLWRRRGYTMQPWPLDTAEGIRQRDEARDKIEASIAAELPEIEAELHDITNKIAGMHLTLDQIDEQLIRKTREFKEGLAFSNADEPSEVE